MNCTNIVSRPVDVCPIRSPQALHTALLPQLRGRNVAEIGFRSGDDVLCYTHVVQFLKAIDIEKRNCLRLTNRLRTRDASVESARQKNASAFTTARVRNVHVSCKGYKAKGVLNDADVITWWHDAPLVDPDILEFLRREQLGGRVLPNAVAIMIHDLQFPQDRPTYMTLKQFADNEIKQLVVDFDEYRQCLKKLPEGYSPTICRRARGQFAATTMPVSRINASIVSSIRYARSAAGTSRQSTRKRHESWVDSLIKKIG